MANKQNRWDSLQKAVYQPFPATLNTHDDAPKSKVAGQLSPLQHTHMQSSLTCHAISRPSRLEAIDRKAADVALAHHLCVGTELVLCLSLTVLPLQSGETAQQERWMIGSTLTSVGVSACYKEA